MEEPEALAEVAARRAELMRRIEDANRRAKRGRVATIAVSTTVAVAAPAFALYFGDRLDSGPFWFLVWLSVLAAGLVLITWWTGPENLATNEVELLALIDAESALYRDSTFDASQRQRNRSCRHSCFHLDDVCYNFPIATRISTSASLVPTWHAQYDAQHCHYLVENYRYTWSRYVSTSRFVVSIGTHPGCCGRGQPHRYVARPLDELNMITPWGI